jgi:hypothetical protein
MRPLPLLIATALLALAVLAGLRLAAPEAPATAASAAADPAAPSGAAALAPEAPPDTDDPEALAGWFQERVMQEYGGETPAAPAPRARPAVAAGPSRSAAVRPARAGRADAGLPDARRPDARRPGRPAPEQPRSPEERFAGRDVDWAYLEDVFSGRVSGIPNERRAGLTLQEIDELGEIPYVEQLREEGRGEELAELGFDEAELPPAWPACLRTATCRRDGRSSPP